MKQLFYLHILIIAFISGPYASIIFVNDDANLQSIINSAANGDVIKVNDNIVQNISISGKTNLRIEANESSYWIGAGNATSILTLDSSQNITIEGFTFSEQRSNECAITINNKSSNITIRDCNIYTNYVSNPGLYNSGAHTFISNCDISGEAFTEGIIGYGDSYPLVINSNIYALNGVYSYHSINCNVEDSEIFGSYSDAVTVTQSSSYPFNLKNNSIYKDGEYSIHCASTAAGPVYVTKKAEADGDLTGGSGFTETFPYGRNDYGTTIIDLN